MSNQTRGNVIDGLLLGDAYIPLRQKFFYFAQKQESREYVEHVATLIGEPLDRIRDRARKPDSRTGKIYSCTELRTLSHPDFVALRQRWYRDGKKVVPEDLKASRELILHWFLCDGSCSALAGRAQMVLCTEGFARPDGVRLRSLLESIGVEASQMTSGRLRVRKKCLGHFYDYIGECPVRCLQYKWIPPEQRRCHQADLRPRYARIAELYLREGWSCEKIGKEFGSNYFSIRYVLKNHFGVRFGKNATVETTCREGVVAPSETTRRAPGDG